MGPAKTALLDVAVGRPSVADARLDDATRARLARGTAVRTALRQGERDPMPAAEQLVVLIAAMEGLFDALSEQQLIDAIARIRAVGKDRFEFIDERISENKALNEEDRKRIMTIAHTVLSASPATHTLSVHEVSRHGSDA